MFEDLACVLKEAQDSERCLKLDRDKLGKLFQFLREADSLSQDAQRDVEALDILRLALQDMVDKDTQNLPEAAKLLADISRDPTWRLPFGHAGILDIFLRVITSTNPSEDLLLQSLRFAGNACSDTDDNRQRVIDGRYLQSIICLLDDENLESIALPVVYNICTDYEPAAEVAKVNGLGRALIKLLERGSMAQSPLLTNICQLLDTFMEDFEPDQSSENAVEVLLRAVTLPDLDFDDRISLADAAITLLKNEILQKRMIAKDLVGVPVEFLISSYSPDFVSDISKVGELTHSSVDQDDQPELRRVRSSLIEVLADLSGLPEFLAAQSDLRSPLIDSLENLLHTNKWQLQLCSCVMLGNLARSDSTCRHMINEMRIHESLFSLLKASTNTQVLHSVLGFLRNLALPSDNKEVLGKANAVEIASRFFATDSLPQLAYAATSLVRQMVNSSVIQTERLLSPLIPEVSSTGHVQTRLSLLLSLFERSDDMPTKTEVARIVVSVLRNHYTLTGADIGQEATESFMNRFYRGHPTVSLPLAMMVYQSKWPAIRSEGWFALALMARTEQGVQTMEPVLKQAEFMCALEDALGRAVTKIGKSTTSTELEVMLEDASIRDSGDISRQPAESQPESKDKENVLVLVHELVKSKDPVIEPLRGTLLELLRTANR